MKKNKILLLIPVFILGLSIIALRPLMIEGASKPRVAPRQCNFTGGVSNQAVSWQNLSGWNKVAVKNDIYFHDEWGLDQPNGPNPYYISSPIDVAGGELYKTHGISTGESLETRQSDTIAGLDSASWFRPSGKGIRATKKYIQFKKGLNNDCVELYFSKIMVRGTVKNSNGNTIKDFKICEGSYCNNEPNFIWEYEKGIYAFGKSFESGGNKSSITLTVTATGYSPTTVTIPLRDTLGNHISDSYYGSYNFILKPVKYTATTTKNQTATTSSAAVKPSAPNVSEIMIDQKKTKIEEGEMPRMIFKKEKGLKFSGTAIPNGIVTLYFQSEPFNDTVTADANGSWSYLLTKDIGEGEHSLETTVTDPATNLVSDKSLAVKFALSYENEGLAKTTDEKNPKEKDYFWYYIAAIVIFTLSAVGIVVFLVIKRVKSKKSSKKAGGDDDKKI